VILIVFFSDNLNNGLKLLKRWNPKKMDDLFVLLQMPMTKLVYLTKKTHLESTIVPHGNRVYYFASTFEVGIYTFYTDS